ncbi:MAG: TrmH family RNA methyltransferase [Negativicutes bacterium]|nr:TrmH family RNA methyltransferase [Negativicutes bacterium]
MDWKLYKKEAETSYTFGSFPTLELLRRRPEAVRRIALHPSFSDRPAAAEISAFCQRHQIPLLLQDKLFKRLSPKENCFVIAEFQKQEQPLQADAAHLVLVNPGNMGNLGSILRSALGFDFLNIAVITPAVDLFDPKVVRGSMGALFSLNISRFASFAAYRSAFPQHLCFPFLLTAAMPLRQFSWPQTAPPALIFGNEATGLAPEYSSVGTAIVIPHSKAIDSLNLAVAVSIALYAAAEQREGCGNLPQPELPAAAKIPPFSRELPL